MSQCIELWRSANLHVPRAVLWHLDPLLGFHVALDRGGSNRSCRRAKIRTRPDQMGDDQMHPLFTTLRVQVWCDRRRCFPAWIIHDIQRPCQGSSRERLIPLSKDGACGGLKPERSPTNCNPL